MSRTAFAALTALAALSLAPAAGARGTAGESTFWTVAEAVERPAGAPAYGSVVFSIRWDRPRSNLSHARQFHADRIEWSYVEDDAWVKEATGQGYFFSAAVNTSLADDPAALGDAQTFEIGRIESQKGEAVGPEHLTAMGQRVGCSNSPGYRKLFTERVERLVRAGADGIHVDGPSGSWGAVVEGFPVCYCDDCRELARRRKWDLGDRTRRSLMHRAGLKSMYEEAMRAAKALNPDVVWSKNGFDPIWYEGLFDYDFAELDVKDGVGPRAFLDRGRREDGPDRRQIFTLRTGDVKQNQLAVALGYATGAPVVAPYDVFPTDGYKTGERYYGKSFHYAPLYALARRCGGLLNGYEDAFRSIPGEADARWAAPPARLDGADPATTAWFVRAKPGDPAGGVAAHLLDRSGRRELGELTLTVRADALGGAGGAYAATVYQPRKWEEGAHESAEAAALEIAAETGDLSAAACREAYAPLVEATAVPGVVRDGEVAFRIPPTWGYALVHITAGPAGGAGK